ncbi:hypothetical protein [Pseudoalteromonas phenolica]|uniref:hypothetical protein n=1 Tax=Pseudoalteromonas phenolica TaxID=161398 RepID=UPI00384B6A21
MIICLRTLIHTSALLSFSVFANSGHNWTVDNQGCWDAKHYGGDNCLTIESKNFSKDSLKVVYKNTCSERIFAKFCHFKNTGYNDCGAAGIKAGNTKTWVTRSGATGHFNYIAVGSDDSNYDWVCAIRLAGKNWDNLDK